MPSSKPVSAKPSNHEDTHFWWQEARNSSQCLFSQSACFLREGGLISLHGCSCQMIELVIKLAVSPLSMEAVYISRVAIDTDAHTHVLVDMTLSQIKSTIKSVEVRFKNTKISQGWQKTWERKFLGMLDKVLYWATISRGNIITRRCFLYVKVSLLQTIVPNTVKMKIFATF